MQIKLFHLGSIAIVLLFIAMSQCWASDNLAFPVEPAVPTAPTVARINIDAQPIFKSHRQILPQAWVLHVTTPGNAALVKRLQQAGFSAYLGDDGKMLYIGPSISQQRLLQERKRIKQQFKLSSTVEDYQITWPTQRKR